MRGRATLRPPQIFCGRLTYLSISATYDRGTLAVEQMWLRYNICDCSGMRPRKLCGCPLIAIGRRYFRIHARRQWQMWLRYEPLWNELINAIMFHHNQTLFGISKDKFLSCIFYVWSTTVYIYARKLFSRQTPLFWCQLIKMTTRGSSLHKSKKLGMPPRFIIFANITKKLKENFS